MRVVAHVGEDLVEWDAQHVRDPEGHVNVVENVCAHRGMRFCRERHGNKKTHKAYIWTYCTTSFTLYTPRSQLISRL